MPEIIRILLFIKPNERPSWERDRLHQRKIDVPGVPPIEWSKCTGILPRYPKRNAALFDKDWFRFIDIQGDSIGDVYVSFNLHDAGKKETLFVVPNENSGGIDFTFEEEKIVDGRVPEADLRWFPLPLPDKFPVTGLREKTYIVIHHLEEVCKNVCAGPSRVDTGKYHYGSPVKRLSEQFQLYLTGGEGGWCERHFDGEHRTLGMKEFFEFADFYPPT